MSSAPARKQQKGQRVAADYYLEPAIIIDNESTGQVGRLHWGACWVAATATFATIAGSPGKSKASVVTLTMFDIRSGVQIAISEGNATATNYGAALGAFGPSAAVARPGRLLALAGRQGHGGRVHRLLQPDGHRPASNYKAQEVKGGLGKGGTAEGGELISPAPRDATR